LLRRCLRSISYEVKALEVLQKIYEDMAANSEKVRKAIGDILRGQAYELPTDRLIRQGRLEGALDMCIALLKDGVISLTEAAKRLSMSEEELMARMS